MPYHLCRSRQKLSGICRMDGICCSANEFVCISMHIGLEFAVDIDLFSHSYIEAHRLHTQSSDREKYNNVIISNDKISFLKMFIKLEVYHSSTISDYTTDNFYSLRRFNRNRRPSSGTECSVVMRETSK